MGSANLNEHQRVSFLKACGFEYSRPGKGGHSIWVNPEAEKKRLMLSDNVKAWEITLCTDPKPGTWRSIEKQARYCHDALNSRSKKFNAAASDYDKRREFRAAREAFCNYKKAVKQHLRGLGVPMPPPARPLPAGTSGGLAFG